MIQKKYNIIDCIEVKSIDLTNELARHPTKMYKLRSNPSKIKRIVIHTTDRDWSIDKLVSYDIEPNHISSTGCPAITYHDVIMKDGSLYHTLPYKEISWHAGGYNSSSIAIALMYQCTDPITNKDTYAPNDNMIRTLQCHCGDLCLKLGLNPDVVVGHRELKGTGWFLNSSGSKRLRKFCPGMAVNLPLLRSNVAKYMQVRMALKSLYIGKIDGIWGEYSREALRRYNAS